VNQIIATLLLFLLVTAVFVPVIISSWDEITSNSISIAEFMDIQQTQNGQILNQISIEQKPGILSLYLMNIGIYEITVDVILLDGIVSPYTLTDQDLNPMTVIPLNQIILLDITGTGNTIQIISESGKLFEFVL